MKSIIDRIAKELCLDREYIKSIVDRSDRYYKRYTIPKRNGTEREIYQASPELKSLQYWVRENILRELPVSNSAFAYQPGDSIKQHASFHSRARFLFHTDIVDFFPSIRSKMLTLILDKHRQKFTDLGIWCDDLCAVVAKICFRHDCLTIGTVSSPIISNIIACDLDEKLVLYCNDRGYHYSRYADDIYISSSSYIPFEIKYTVEEYLRTSGFKLNKPKTWFRSRASCQKVTGLVLADAGYISVGCDTKRKIKGMIYNRLIHGQGNPEVILGYLAFLKDIEPDVFNRYMIKYSTYCNGDVVEAILNGPIKVKTSIPVPGTQ